MDDDAFSICLIFIASFFLARYFLQLICEKSSRLSSNLWRYGYLISKTIRARAAKTFRRCKFSRWTACTLGVLERRVNAGASRAISYGSAVRPFSFFLPYFFLSNLFQPYLRTPGCRAGDRTEEVHLSASERANFPVGRSLKALGVSWDAFMTPGWKGNPRGDPLSISLRRIAVCHYT